ncbi:cytochrome P450 3A5-like [Dermacentor variabilis]|uniref:cytochrome P450 3A5-like n=1 Tax=Dermacentor variabilis TaxID=34621 RepID=UPI003F5B6337
MFEFFSASFVLSAVFCLCYAVVRWLISERKKCFDAFDGTGIPGPPLRNLVNGNADEFMNPSQIESIGRWLKEYGDVFGFYLGDTPFVVVKDPVMISEIFAREFNNFSARGHLLRIHELEPTLERNLVLVGGRQWKETRICMQQFFTPAKLKLVMPALVDAQREFLSILGECADSGAEVDIGSRCERLTFDVISKAAFNLDTQVQRHPENPLFQAAVLCFPNIMKGFLHNLGINLYHWPWVIKIFQKPLSFFFTNHLVQMTKHAAELIKFRHQNPQVDVPDMAQLLLDDALEKRDSATKKKEATTKITAPLSQEKLHEIGTNCMDIFLGGYDTTRLALTYWFYLMGKHPDIQERMRKEVLEAFTKEDDELSIQTLTSLRYTNQVLSETLRMYPPIISFTTRCAGEDYQSGKYLIKKGTSVMVPTYHLHHDPMYWTDPEKFDPERFSPKNKHLINPAVYQPFGLGVRVCIGQRLALIEMASVTSQVLRRFRITHGPSQKPDLELDTYAFVAAPKDEVWIHLHKLNSVK